MAEKEIIEGPYILYMHSYKLSCMHDINNMPNVFYKLHNDYPAVCEEEAVQPLMQVSHKKSNTVT